MASTASSYSNIGDRNVNYVGDLVNQRRHGYGTYSYTNSFFRYEGEWKDGKKHGHGKLIMADGSYYEGEFKNGEIMGHGFKKWTNTGNSYTGEFYYGELDGEGVLDYGKNGAQYQGSFVRNQRQGKGVLREPGGQEYTGFFYKDRRHGTGQQIYSNGDRYEGDWVCGEQQGHGQLISTDGSMFKGQWRASKFNGEGKYLHTSGVSYEGMWLNGRPLNEAAHLTVNPALDGNTLTVKPGQTFTIGIQLLDINGYPVEGEKGRKFQVKAGHRSAFNMKKNFERNSILKMIEVHERSNDRITTPFGFSAIEYPLMEIPEELLDDFERVYCSSPVETEKQASQSCDEPSGDSKNNPSLSHEEAVNKDHRSTESGKSSQGSSRQRSRSNSTSFTLPEEEVQLRADRERVDAFVKEFLGKPVEASRSEIDGSFTFANLYLPNPFQAFGELLQDLEEQERERQMNGEDGLPTGNFDLRRTSSPSKGEYVLVVSEVTDPPFLGEHLPELYISVNVLSPPDPKENQKSRCNSLSSSTNSNEHDN